MFAFWCSTVQPKVEKRAGKPDPVKVDAKK